VAVLVGCTKDFCHAATPLHPSIKQRTNAFIKNWGTRGFRACHCNSNDIKNILTSLVAIAITVLKIATEQQRLTLQPLLVITFSHCILMPMADEISHGNSSDINFI
jgi:hypothetical protein